jgi:hypothetical protein
MFLSCGRRILPPVHFKFLSQDSHFQTIIGAGAKCIWIPDHEKAFEDIKSLLFKSPILRFPDFSKPMYLHTDALSYCLMQRGREFYGTFLYHLVWKKVIKIVGAEMACKPFRKFGCRVGCKI